MPETTTLEEFTLEELQDQHAAELPDRELMLGLSLLGIPLLSVSGLDLHIT